MKSTTILTGTGCDFHSDTNRRPLGEADRWHSQRLRLRFHGNTEPRLPGELRPPIVVGLHATPCLCVRVNPALYCSVLTTECTQMVCFRWCYASVQIGRSLYECQRTKRVGCSAQQGQGNLLAIIDRDIYQISGE